MKVNILRKKKRMELSKGEKTMKVKEKEGIERRKEG